MGCERQAITFALPSASWSISFTATTIKFMEGHSQRRWINKESVGQLFTKDLTQSLVVVDLATRLKPRRSSWASVTFDPEGAMAEREKFFKEGLHCIGLWHTHPEPIPVPSGRDATLAADHAVAASSVLNGLGFVIVGNQPFPDGWYIGFNDGREFHKAAVANG